MGNLPSSRTITLDQTSAVPSALLNELQDAIVGGLRPSQINKFMFPSTAQWSATTAGEPFLSNPNPGSVLIGVPQCLEGDTIGNMSIVLRGNSGGTAILTVAVNSVTASGVSTQITSVAFHPGASVRIVGAIPVTPFVVPAGGYFTVTVDQGSTTNGFVGVLSYARGH